MALVWHFSELVFVFTLSSACNPAPSPQIHALQTGKTVFLLPACALSMGLEVLFPNLSSSVPSGVCEEVGLSPFSWMTICGNLAIKVVIAITSWVHPRYWAVYDNNLINPPSNSELTKKMNSEKISFEGHKFGTYIWLQSRVFIIIIILAALGLWCCARTFSSCREWGLLSSCNEWSSHCGGFSCWGVLALGCMGSAVAARGLIRYALPPGL